MHSILRRTHRVSSDQIKALVQSGGRFQEAEAHDFPIDGWRFVFPSLLKACASPSHFRHGEALHCAITKMGFRSDPFIVTSLVRMYAKSASLPGAVKVFDEMSQSEVLLQDAAVWNSIIDGYFKSRFFEEGMAQFRRMQVLSVKPDGYTLCILLGFCNVVSGGSFGKEIHGYVFRNAFDGDPFVITATIDMYSRSSRPNDAYNVFSKCENKHGIVAWNAMINGFAENGLWMNSLWLYLLAKAESLELGSTTFSSVLTACSKGKAVDFGPQLHCDVVKKGLESDPYVSTSLLTFYSKCGLVKDSERVFYSTREGREVGIWNSMISAYVNRGCANDALRTYVRMRVERICPDSFTLSNALIACGLIGCCSSGSMVHVELVKRPIKDSVTVQSALLTMYSRVGSLQDARKVFDEMKDKDVVAWGSMISACCEKKRFTEALDLYKTLKKEGVESDSSVITSAVIACVGYGDEKIGTSIHGLAIKEGLDLDAFTGSALIEFYSKCGKPDMAKEAFLNVLQRNLVVWNSLMSCYSENALPDISVSLLSRILEDGLVPDLISITTALSAVSRMAALLKGKAVHCYHIKSLFSNEIQMENTLIDMYIKCGCFVYALRVFDKMPKRDTVAWNTMIAGYGSHGECPKAIGLFREMRDSGTPPDEITFLSLISSCNHSGFVDEGLRLFRSMGEHGVEPKSEHYVNIIDLLGRAGCLDEAFSLVEENMAIQTDRGVWFSLLSACRVHRNVELGERAGKNLIEMEPERGGNYVQLLNLYVEAGLKEKAAELRVMMRRMGLSKVPGCSWIEVRNKVEVFFSGDHSFSDRTLEIFEVVDGLRNCMKRTTECSLASSSGVAHEYEACL